VQRHLLLFLLYKVNLMPKKPPLGSGQRFKNLESKLSQQGVKDPAALAASIGRKKFGAKKFNNLSAKGRKGN
jgi:hypothetical protein